MTATREAVVLPLAFLTVALFGGLEPGAADPWAPPSLFALVLAVMIIAALVRSGTVDPERLLRGSRSSLENANGLVVLVALLVASAQVLNMLTPRSGLPALIVGFVLFVLLMNTLVMSPDRPRLLRSFAVVTSSAFVLKFVILGALADPDGGRTKRVLLALFDAATLGTITQAPLPASAGYIAFAIVVLFLVAVALLPSAEHRLPRLLESGERAIVRTES
ncbi:MAG: hypothetical protein H0W08_26835 [Acidobacteria bacterium]|nr:hypothetical protein [Acidobacteriota bacterium]